MMNEEFALYARLTELRRERIERETAYYEVFIRQPGENSRQFWQRFNTWDALYQSVIEWGQRVYGETFSWNGGQFIQRTDGTNLTPCTIERRRVDDTVIYD